MSRHEMAARVDHKESTFLTADCADETDYSDFLISYVLPNQKIVSKYH